MAQELFAHFWTHTKEATSVEEELEGGTPSISNVFTTSERGFGHCTTFFLLIDLFFEKNH